MSKKKNRKLPNSPTTRHVPVPAVVLDAFIHALAGNVDRVHYEPSDDEVCITAKNHEAMDSILDRLSEVVPPCACGDAYCNVDRAESLQALKRVRWGSSANDAGPVWVCDQYDHLFIVRPVATFLAGALHGVRAA